VEQLEDEMDEVREYASRKMNALLASELEYYEAYANSVKSSPSNTC
jgi:hypothetical protein